MKKMKNVLMMAGFLFVVFTGKASEEKEVTIGAGQMLSVELSALEAGAVLILREKKGAILYKDSLFKNEPYKTSFDLRLLPEGNYSLELDKTFTVQSWEITKDDKGLEVLGNKPAIFFKPQFKVEENFVKVLLINPSEAKTRLEVFDSKGEVLGVCQDKKVTFKRTLDFSEVPGGTYTIRVENGDQTFLKKIKIG